MDISSYLTLLFFAFAMTSGLLLVFIRYSCKLKLLKDASERHHLHSDPTPLVGGMAIIVAIFILSKIIESPVITVYTATAMSLLTIVGVLDDRGHISPPYRLVTQITAASLLVAGNGTIVTSLGNILGFPLELGNWAIPFTIFAIVGIINAFNMMDGINGLASSLAIIPLTAIFIISEPSALSNFALIVIGASLAFLVFNLGLVGKNRTTFLGDAGSTLLGFIVAWLIIEAVNKQDNHFSPVAGLLLVAIPVVDAIAIMIRRKLAGKSPFLADKRHLHHIVMLTGKSSNFTLIAIGSASTILAYLSIHQNQWRLPDPFLFSIFIGLFGLLFMVNKIAASRYKTHKKNAE